MEGSVVVLAVTEGKRALMVLKGDRPETLTKGLVHAVMRRQDQEMTPLIKDVEKGREVHAVYAVNLNGGEFEVSPPRGRITTFAYDGKDGITYTVSTEGQLRFT